MSLFSSCHRLAFRRAARPYAPPARPSSTKSTAAEILTKPTWSISTLFTPSSAEHSPSSSTTPSPSPESITPAQLHHLLRLSALPLPKSPDEEKSMIETIQSQLRFVQAVQRVDTTDVEPLTAIRDETLSAVGRDTIGLGDLQDILDKEVSVGFWKRPRRIKDGSVMQSEAENWNALSTASKTVGKYFVVESGKKVDAGEP